MGATRMTICIYRAITSKISALPSNEILVTFFGTSKR